MLEGSGQIITTPYEVDVEVKDVEKISSCLKEEFSIIPRDFEERKLSDAGFPPLLIKQQEVFNHIVQYPFSLLLETSEGEVFKVCLRLTSEYNLLDRASFQAKIHFQFALLLSRFCFLPLKKGLLISQSMNTMLTWLHWIFDFS